VRPQHGGEPVDRRHQLSPAARVRRAAELLRGTGELVDLGRDGRVVLAHHLHKRAQGRVVSADQRPELLVLGVVMSIQKGDHEPDVLGQGLRLGTGQDAGGGQYVAGTREVTAQSVVHHAHHGSVCRSA